MAPGGGRNERPQQDNDFLTTWKSALVSAKPQLLLPTRGLRGAVVLLSSGCLVVALAAAVVVVPKSLPSFASDNADGGRRLEASGADRVPTPQAAPSEPGASTTPVAEANESAKQDPAPLSPAPQVAAPPLQNAPPGSSVAPPPGSQEPQAARDPETTPTKKPSRRPQSKPTKPAANTPEQAARGSAATGELNNNSFAPGRSVSVRAVNTNYIQIESSYDGGAKDMLRAGATSSSAGARFAFTWHPQYGAWTLTGSNGRYVTAELDGSGNQRGMLRARSSSISAWELFNLYRFSDGTYALRSNESKSYVSAEFNDGGGQAGMLRARSGSAPAGGWERFSLS